MSKSDIMFLELVEKHLHLLYDKVNTNEGISLKPNYTTGFNFLLVKHKDYQTFIRLHAKFLEACLRDRKTVEGKINVQA